MRGKSTEPGAIMKWTDTIRIAEELAGFFNAAAAQIEAMLATGWKGG